MTDKPELKEYTEGCNRQFGNAPCFLCGYNRADYYQPSTHKCAEYFHGDKPWPMPQANAAWEDGWVSIKDVVWQNGKPWQPIVIEYAPVISAPEWKDAPMAEWMTARWSACFPNAVEHRRPSPQSAAWDVEKVREIDFQCVGIYDERQSFRWGVVFKSAEDREKFIAAAQKQGRDTTSDGETQRALVAKICRAANLENPELKYQTQYWEFAVKVLRQPCITAERVTVEELADLLHIELDDRFRHDIGVFAAQYPHGLIIVDSAKEGSDGF